MLSHRSSIAYGRNRRLLHHLHDLPLLGAHSPARKDLYVLIPEPTGHIHLKGESSRHSLVCGECRVHPFFSCIRSGRCRSVIKVFTPPRRALNAGRNAMVMVGGRRVHWALWACPNAHHRCRSRRGPNSHQRPRTGACRARIYHNFRIVTQLALQHAGLRLAKYASYHGNDTAFG